MRPTTTAETIGRTRYPGKDVFVFEPDQTPNKMSNTTQASDGYEADDKYNPTNKPKSIHSRYASSDPFVSLKQAIADAIRSGEKALFQAPPGIGKSRSLTMIADEVGKRINIFTNLRDHYDEFEQWADKDGIPSKRFPTSSDCPHIDASNHDWPVGLIHDKKDPHPGTKCEYEFLKDCIELWRQRPKQSVCVGNPIHARNPANVNGKIIAFDEDAFDAFTDRVDNPIAVASEFVETLDNFPFDTARRPDPGEAQQATQAAERVRNEGIDPYDHSDAVGEYHPYAPLTAYAIFAADRKDNGQLIAELPGDGYATFTDDSEKITIFRPPDLSNAAAVICLDATPDLNQWRAVVGNDLVDYQLFSDDERMAYLRREGYEFRQLHSHQWGVQTTDSSRLPSIDKAEAYLHEIARKHGKKPDVISSMAMLDELSDNLYARSLHFGDFHGRNDLKESELLVVLGAPIRSDDRVKKESALLGEVAEPATDADGDRLGGRNLDYQNDVANQLAFNNVEDEVFQAMLRAGRTVDSDATVYVATRLIPEWLDVKRVGQRIDHINHDAVVDLHDMNSSKRDVINALRGSDEISTAEIAHKVDLTKKTARNHLRDLMDEGSVQKIGSGPATKYVDNGLETENPIGKVDLSPV